MQSRRARLHQQGILPHRRCAAARARQSARRASLLRCCRSSSSNPSARAPVERGAASSSRAGTPRRDAARFGQLREHVQIGDAGQAVGSERDRRRQRRRRTRAAARRRRRRRCCAGTTPASRPTRFTRARSSPSNCTPCTTSDARVEEAETGEVLGRRHARESASASVQTPSRSSIARAGAGAVAQQLDFLGRLAEVHGRHRVRMRIDIGADRLEERRRHRIRRVRRQADANAVRRRCPPRRAWRAPRGLGPPGRGD